MFDSILVPLDGSVLAEHALPHAIAIARAFNSQVTVLQVLEPQSGTPAHQLDTLNWEINKAQAQIYLGNIRDRLQKQGVRVEAEAQGGRVAEEIIIFTERQNIQLIILSSHGRSGVSYWGISSVTQKIIQSAPTSVLLVRADEPPASEEAAQIYRRILVPLDGSQRAENVLSVIERLARSQNAELHIAHVVTVPEMARHLPPKPEDVELADRIVARNREEAERYLEQLKQASSFEGLSIKTHLITSEDAGAALHDLAMEQQIDLLVLSAHGYSGSQDWPYGRMANTFISYGKIHLLVVQDLPVRHEPTLNDLRTRETGQP